MKKLFAGLATLVFGIFWTIATLYAAFSDDEELLTFIIILVLFTLPGIIMIYNGIVRIRNYFFLKKNASNPDFKLPDETPVFNDETTLIHWEIKGAAWERFKERKCTPEAVNRAASLYAVASGIGAGAVILLIFIEQSRLVMLSAGSIVFVLTAAISFYFLRKAEFNKYGFANGLSKGELVLTSTYANFCGKIIPLNVKKREVFKLQILEKNGFSYLFLRVWKGSLLGSSFEYYEFPIPEDKLAEARKLI